MEECWDRLERVIKELAGGHLDSEEQEFLGQRLLAIVSEMKDKYKVIAQIEEELV